MADVSKGKTFSSNEEVTSTKLHQLVDNATVTNIGTSDLGATCVTEAKIATGAVTNTKLGADCVDGSKIGDDVIDSEHYVTGSIDTEHIADNQVTSAKLEDDLAFGTFPTTPASAPDADYEVANKKYVDDNAGMGGAKTGVLAVTSTGSVSITGLPFTPKSVTFIGGYKDATDVKPGFSYGIWDGTNMYSLATTFVAGDTSGKGGIVGGTFRIIDASVTQVEFSGTSLDSGGFTVNVTTADANYYVRYLAQG